MRARLYVVYQNRIAEVFVQRAILVLILFLPVTADTASAQTYPTKPLRIVTAEAGGSNDLVARIIAQALANNLGQQVIVDNRGQVIAPEVVARAQPDGYTLLLDSTTLWIGPLLRHITSYDAVRSFAPITLIASAPNLLVIHPLVPANSVKELIAHAKANPGRINYASGPAGASNHLAAELFRSIADISIVRIAYKGGGPGLTALIGGEVQIMFPTVSSGMPHVKASRLRALAVTSPQTSSFAPGVPTLANAGLAGAESSSVLGMFVPARTSATLISRLNQEILRTLNQQDVSEKLIANGTEIAGSTPQQFASAIQADIVRLGKVIRDAGITIE